MKKHVIILAALLATFGSFGSMSSHASVTLLEKDGWKASMGGFIEVDALDDSTRSLVESTGNTPISRPNTLAGETGRAQLSIRTSRLSFTVEAPEVDGWHTKGYYEMDFQGFDPTPGTPTGAANSEAGFFNNPTMRSRHIYLSAEHDGWQILAGQYWNIFGMQPYYFIPTLQTSPVSAMAYGRTMQLRAAKKCELNDKTALDTVFGVMRPPQRDASLPGLEGGLRLTFNDRASGFAGGAMPEKVQPMGIGISGAVREFVVPRNEPTATGDVTHLPGGAVAVDALLPVIASKDGKDVGNTLTIGGEFTTGTGDGDQFQNWTGSLASPLNSVTTAPEKNVNLDAGIGGFDPAGNFKLVDLRTFNAHFQYHLPTESHTWITGGYGRLYSDNINNLTVGLTGLTSSGSFPYDKQQIYFGNIFHDFSKQLRMALEFVHTRTEYGDAVMAHNNRYQLSAFFIF